MSEFKQLRCLEALLKYQNNFSEIVIWLEKSHLITASDVIRLKNFKEIERGVELTRLLNDLESNENVQMIDYLWNYLPKEQIRITIVTKAEVKDFTYGME